MSVSTAFPGPAGSAGTAAAGLALDARSLASLRKAAATDPEASAKEAASQFEALFMQQILKSMRAAMPKSGMFHGPGSETYTSLLDTQLAQAMSGAPGGLADLIARQITRHMETVRSGERAHASAGTSAGAGVDAGPGSGGRANRIAGSAVPPGGPIEGTDGARDAQALRDSFAKRLDSHQAEFVERMWPHAMAAQERTGLPAAYVVGQAALESGWGRRDIRDADGRPSHNLFGIKATGGWQGETVAVMTTEYVDGEPRKVVEQFRRYDSYADAFTDWARLISGSARYAGVLKAASAADFARGLGEAGYATDPRYSEKLERTINQTLRLRRLDM